MRFPDRAALGDALPDLELPTLFRVVSDPPSPELSDSVAAAEAAVDELPTERLEPGATVAVGLGSRGITDIVPIATTVVESLRGRGYEPVVVPAMGSHGGATAEGQRRTLADFGLDEETLGCPVEARMETEVVAETASGWPVYTASAALEADAWLVVNRVKPHTNFTGRIESGLCKMATIGMGKREGAKTIHEFALRDGYVDSILEALQVLERETPFLGGVAIVENFYERTAAVEGIAAGDLPEREAPLLEDAREYMPTLPFDDLDVLVVERIGKDVSGAGMDTNVIGRYRVLNAEDPETPDIKRIAVLGLTEATHGNGQGIGLADVTTRDAVSGLDLQQVYTNALTSASLSKASLPVVLPDEELAIRAALSTIGPYDPSSVRLAWIRDTDHLASFHVSAALADSLPEHVAVEAETELTFESGTARIEGQERDATPDDDR
jgi:hypothetical protein